MKRFISQRCPSDCETFRLRSPAQSRDRQVSSSLRWEQQYSAILKKLVDGDNAEGNARNFRRSRDGRSQSDISFQIRNSCTGISWSCINERPISNSHHVTLRFGEKNHVIRRDSRQKVQKWGCSSEENEHHENELQKPSRVEQSCRWKRWPTLGSPHRPVWILLA